VQSHLDTRKISRTLWEAVEFGVTSSADEMSYELLVSVVYGVRSLEISWVKLLSIDLIMYASQYIYIVRGCIPFFSVELKFIHVTAVGGFDYLKP
jgi:hypothetical protein